MYPKTTWLRPLVCLILFVGLTFIISTAYGQKQPDSYGVSVTSKGDWFSYRPAMRGTQRAVVSTNPLATQAGVQILEKGRNAFDAAVAALAALGVVEPSHSGIGGENFYQER